MLRRMTASIIIPFDGLLKTYFVYCSQDRYSLPLLEYFQLHKIVNFLIMVICATFICCHLIFFLSLQSTVDQTHIMSIWSYSGVGIFLLLSPS